MKLSVVGSYIEKMKRVYRVETDEQLAAKLGKAKQTIASWRRRNTIPDSVVAHMTRAFGLNFANVDGSIEESTYSTDDCIQAAKMAVFERFLAQREWTAEERLCIAQASSAIEEALEAIVINLPIESGLFLDDRLISFLEGFNAEAGMFETIIHLVSGVNVEKS